MEKSQEWYQLKVKMESGMPLGADLDMHIARFKEIVYIRNLNLESEEVKGFFVKSMPPAFHPGALKNQEGKYRSFTELEQFAQEGRNCFDEYLRGKAKELVGSVAVIAPGTSESTYQGNRAANITRPVATSIQDHVPKRFDKQSRLQRVRCHICHKWGHLAKDCKNKPPEQKKQE